MGIPVPIPAGPLPVTDQQVTQVELFVAALAQVTKAGTDGAVVNTPPLLVQPGPNQPAAPVSLDTHTAQLYLRQLGHALVAAFPNGGAGGGPTTANLVSVVPSGNLSSTNVQMALQELQGDIDVILARLSNTFIGTISNNEVIGDLVVVSGASKAVKRPVNSDLELTPVVGIITDKIGTAVTVQFSGTVPDVYTDLAPGRTYFVGNDGRLSLTPPTGSPGTELHLQVVGVAIDTNILLLAHNPTVASFFAP